VSEVAAQVSSGAAPPAAEHERTRVVLGAVAALALLAGAAWWMAAPRAHSLDAPTTYAAWFEPRELPFGLRAAQAEKLARGDVLLRFEREGLEPEAPRVTPPEPAEPPKPGGGEMPQFDWSKVDWGTAGQPPREVVIASLPLTHAKADLDTLFKDGLEFRGDFGALHPGAKRVLGHGVAPWGELDCPWVHEREFELGGTFRDVIRVNLSRGRDPRVLIARFGRGEPASIPPVEALLAALPSK
jgi:hypothetical protein